MIRFVLLLLASAVALHAAEPPFGGAVRFEQPIGERLPLATRFTDAAGVNHTLGEFFHGKPVVIYFGYAKCPQLCSLVADGTVAALRELRPEVGRDYEVISLSVDPTETLQENHGRQLDAVRRYGRPANAGGWNFLTGDETAIHALTEAAGFYYTHDERSHQYAHPSGFLIATPDGKVSRYFLGVDFEPRDVAKALKRAADGETGLPVFDLLLLCFRGDGVNGRYGAIIWRTLEIAVSLTVLALAGGIGWFLLKEHRAQPHRTEGTS